MHTKRIRRIGPIVGILLATAAPVVRSQEPAPITTSPVPLIVGGALGSVGGLMAGASLGARTGWGGGDDPGLIGAVIFAGVGAVVGTALGVEAASGGRVPFGTAVGASLAGFVTAWAVASAMRGDAAVSFAFPISQGFVAGLLAGLGTRR